MLDNLQAQSLTTKVAMSHQDTVRFAVKSDPLCSLSLLIRLWVCLDRQGKGQEHRRRLGGDKRWTTQPMLGG